jgi:hypothetical protein
MCHLLTIYLNYMLYYWVQWNWPIADECGAVGGMPQHGHIHRHLASSGKVAMNTQATHLSLRELSCYFWRIVHCLKPSTFFSVPPQVHNTT